MDKREMERALKRAIKKKPSAAAFARSIGVSPQRVNDWVQRMKMCPPQFAIPIEDATGVPRWQLRPDMYPPEQYA